MEKKLEASRPPLAYGWVGLRRDLVAGLTVAAVALPQAMAYALIAGVEPIYGLYTAIIMTALGSLFGSSAHLINGPTNAISLVVFGALAGITITGPDEIIRAVGVLAVLVGLIQIAIALLKLGDLTRYVSESVVIGFMTGAGALVALTQTPTLLGLTWQGSREDHLLWRLWLTWTRGGPVDWRALAIGLVGVARIYSVHRLGGRLKVRLPELLITLIVVSSAVHLFRLAPDDGRIGHLDVARRLPAFQAPLWNPEWIRRLWGGALAIALLGLVEALAVAKAIAART